MSSYYYDTSIAKGREYNNTKSSLPPIDEDNSVTPVPRPVINDDSFAHSKQQYQHDTAGNGDDKSSSICAYDSTSGDIDENRQLNYSLAESSRSFPLSDRPFPISWKFIVILGVLATGVGAGIYFISSSVEGPREARSKTPNLHDDHARHRVPSSAPTILPTVAYPTQTELSPSFVNLTTDEELQQLDDLFLEISGNASTSDFTPQGKARLWFHNDTLSIRISTHGRARVIQRFVLTVLYLSMKGSESFGENFAVAGENECTWRGVGCDNNFIIKQLGLGNENLTGTLPTEIGYLTKLVRLSIHSNSLTGQLPASLWLLDSLLFLDMAKNRFTGTLPPNISSLSRLRSLLLDDNLFHGSLPEDIGDLSLLNELSIPMNRFTGELPENIWSLGSLVHFDVSQNHLNGTLSSNITFLSNVTSLLMYQNSFSGSLPEEMGNLRNLTKLFLSNNSFTGDLPESLWSLESLVKLDLSQNHFHGTLSRMMWSLSGVTVLLLDQNLLIGSLPDIPEDIMAAPLVKLRIHDNGFTGTLPETLNRLSNTLQQLALSFNDFSSTIPTHYSQLTHLTYLNLASNNLVGSIPPFADTVSLLYLNDNNLTGTLSERLPASSKEVWLNSNALTGSIPNDFGVGLENLTSLLIYDNHLSGQLPSALCSQTNLVELKSDCNVTCLPCEQK